MDDIEEEAGPLEIHLWTWSRRYFGSSDGTALWIHRGRLAGRFHQDEIYGAAGRYLGEVRDTHGLIACSSKRTKEEAVTDLSAWRLRFYCRIRILSVRSMCRASSIASQERSRITKLSDRTND